MTVIIYSKPACVQCSATYRAFERLGINYRVIDISQDSQALSFVTQLGYRQVPVIVAGDLHWAGFRPDMITRIQ
ncbi:MAG: glutaredoxin-like protein NrdH [Candidatus Tokpelaia sp. JSC188]|nr:MAG: glutaredoxin-like protein NrdH [Candidatus Tokpelaia sp. JSC188]